MDLLKTLLADATPRIVDQLGGRLGLSPEAAGRLVPAVADSALNALRERREDLDLDDLAGLAKRLGDEIDAEEIGRRTGLGTETARLGAATVLPELLATAERKARLFGGLSGVAKRLAGGSSAPSSGLGGLAGKLFGR